MDKAKTIPSARIKGLTFYPIPEFSKADVAFGASEELFFNRRDLPEVPSKYISMASNLFFKGGDISALGLDHRINIKAARAALGAWLGSWAPAHEAKEATVGYALWVWSTPESIDAAIAAK